MSIKPKYKHSLYNTWRMMKQRCYNPNHISYPYYGGVGVRVCDRWLSCFTNFLEDMGEKPEGYTLDRKDGEGDYTPDNCRWATKHTQSSNQRLFKTNTSGVKGVSWTPRKGKFRVMISVRGVRHSVGYFLTLEEAIQAKDKFLKENV